MAGRKARKADSGSGRQKRKGKRRFILLRKGKNENQQAEYLIFAFPSLNIFHNFLSVVVCLGGRSDDEEKEAKSQAGKKKRSETSCRDASRTAARLQWREEKETGIKRARRGNGVRV
mmetsp:Transcript_41732/g.82399  ORF Transcript_41732/g.82399 Transcript_41732/m.82399 type:complete len:117 (-) Transcript_41732:585-935(-)